MNTTHWMSIAAVSAAMVLAMPESTAKPGKGKGKPAHAEKGNKGKGPNKAPGKKAKGADKGPGNKAKPGQPTAKRLEKAAKNRAKAAARADAKRPRVDLATWRFEDRERRRIETQFATYRDREHGLPPGLAKNLRRGKQLPPGWQKKLRRGHVIERGWWDSLTPVSYGLLPGIERHPDTALYLYNDRLIRVHEPRREIIDILRIPTISLQLR